MIPRLAKFVSMGGFVTFFAEMPISPAERVRVHKMWVDDHSYIEPSHAAIGYSISIPAASKKCTQPA